MNRTGTVTFEAEPPSSHAQHGTENDVYLDGFIRLAPKTHDISLAAEHIPDIAYLAADLEKAVKAGWSRRHDMRYLKVHVLLLRWADDDLGVATELRDLQHVFQDLYHYTVEVYEIPSHKPDKALTRRVLDFLDQDGEETLFVLYYAGHARTGAHSIEGPTWFANRQPGSGSLPSRGIQSKFEEADADVLLLYDCCNSAATTASSSHRGHKSVTEVIAACGCETVAPEVGEHSFSNALTETLAAASKGPPISVAELHARVLNRLKCWSPSFLKDDAGKFSEDETGRLKCELQRRRTPIYGLLCETEPRRSIAFGPLGVQSPQQPITSPPNPRKRKRSAIEDFECPQILLAIRLDKHELDIQAWKECLLRQLPAAAKDIKIEGIYGSFSTLLLLRVPVFVWNLLPPSSAYSFVGFVTTENMATVNVQRAQSPEAASSKVEPAFVDQSLIQKVTPIIFEELDKAELFGGFPRIETPYQPDVKDQGAAFSKDIHTSAGSQQSAVSRYNIPTDWTGGNCSLEAFRENSFRRVYDLSRSDDGAISAVSQTLVRTEVRTNQRVGLLGKRRRASKPKIKTGCITCITRRVKCDGSKPECLRCQKFGRRCEGYLQSSSQFRGLMQLQPRIPTLSLYSPSNTIHSTEEESRYFRTFSEHTATELPGYFEATFWTRLVLQESHNVPAIRHAVVALGAMTKSLETAPGPGLKVNVLQTADKKHHENAVLAHIKAIRELNRYISSSNSPQLRYALIACLLFVCFETFQGSQASSIQQTYGGLKLLQSYYLGKPGSRPWIPQRSEAKDAQSGHDTKDSIRRKSSTSISTATISSSSLNTNTKGQPFGQEVNTTLQKRQEDIPAASHHEIDHNSILSTYEPPLHVSASQVAEERPLLASSPTPQPLSNDLILEEILIQTLVRLDGQGLFFGLPPGIPPLIWDIYKVWHLPLPPTFPDFLSARRYWDFCMDRALQFYRRTLFNRNYSPDQSDLPNSIITQYMSFVDEITAFEKAFAPILAAAVSNDRFPAVENPAALVLSLYPKCTLILLSYISDSEMIFDVHFEDFEYIIRTCKLLLASEATTQLPKNTRFSFDVGIVPPLHLTATKCRDPVVRREAIDLLFQSPRQEGMWDGVLSARIGRWITTVEEEGLIPPTIPESFRHGARDVRTEGGYVEQEVKFNYPTPPHVMDYSGAESSTRNDNEDVEMVDVVREPTELGELAVESEDTVINEEPQNAAHDSDTNAGAKTNSKWSKDKEWVVPEGNRVKLVEVDFHIPDRYIKVKCQKVLTDQDGSRQERETVIAW